MDMSIPFYVNSPPTFFKWYIILHNFNILLAKGECIIHFFRKPIAPWSER